MKVRIPKKASLRKYGLRRHEWLALLNAQGNVCAICRKLPPSGRMVTDHEHVKGFKKMPPEERKKFVRGILCWQDNHAVMRRGVTLQRLKNALQYLEAYEKRSKG